MDPAGNPVWSSDRRSALLRLPRVSRTQPRGGAFLTQPSLNRKFREATLDWIETAVDTGKVDVDGELARLLQGE
ncbi:DUF6192 family protein [Streptomyces sp. H34-S5]|nr:MULTISPECIES: DUF6192 family protein [unclassified Streptomyces]MCY0947202.1 DUF6192 family protein [Streptomyces sp. H34-AA3]MCZ4087900.1 DUF6192 family protein [Streptomyces sp. H34-S5]